MRNEIIASQQHKEKEISNEKEQNLLSEGGLSTYDTETLH
jgi:hypothetical protein